jgi:hypothetical protein
MKSCAITLILALACLTGCSKSSPPAATNAASSTKTPDAVQQKLQEYSGAAATDCGRLNVQASADQSKAVADCAVQSSRGKRPFYVAYDMPGMALGVAGNADRRGLPVAVASCLERTGHLLRAGRYGSDGRRTWGGDRAPGDGESARWGHGQSARRGPHDIEMMGREGYRFRGGRVRASVSDPNHSLQ